MSPPTKPLVLLVFLLSAGCGKASGNDPEACTRQCKYMDQLTSAIDADLEDAVAGAASIEGLNPKSDADAVTDGERGRESCRMVRDRLLHMSGLAWGASRQPGQNAKVASDLSPIADLRGVAEKTKCERQSPAQLKASVVGVVKGIKSPKTDLAQCMAACAK